MFVVLGLTFFELLFSEARFFLVVYNPRRLWAYWAYGREKCDLLGLSKCSNKKLFLCFLQDSKEWLMLIHTNYKDIQIEELVYKVLLL